MTIKLKNVKYIKKKKKKNQDYTKSMCTSSDHGKNTCKVSKKSVWEELHPQGTLYLYTLIVLELEN